VYMHQLVEIRAHSLLEQGPRRINTRKARAGYTSLYDSVL
jgi:hypothetical protein